MTVLVRYDNCIVATVGHSRAYLAPDIEQLPDGDPVLRFVTMMCAYALEVAQKRILGPYTDERAAEYARAALIDDADFSSLRGLDDEWLASHFGVPADQVRAKREAH